MDLSRLILTRNELLTILTIMQCRTMNGLPEDPLAGQSPGEVEASLNGGEFTLLERSLLSAGDGDTIAMDPRVVELVGAAVLPSATLLVGHVQDGTQSTTYYGAGARGLYAHREERAGLFSFWEIEDSDSLQEQIVMDLDGLSACTEGDGASCQISAAVFSQFMLGAQDGLSTSILAEMLSQAGVSDDMSVAIAEGVSTLRFWYAVVGYGLDQPESQGGDAVVAVANGDRCWLLENQPKAETGAVLWPATGAEARGRLASLAGYLRAESGGPDSSGSPD